MMNVKALILTIGLSLVSPWLFAHSLHVIAQYDGDTISGKAYYSDLTPARQTYIAVFENDNTLPSLEGITDQQGRFRYPFANRQKIRVVVEGEEGHKAETVADRIVTQGQQRDEIGLLREDIAALKDKIYFRDVLGGIGYIFGIIGVVSLWSSSRRRKTQEKG